MPTRISRRAYREVHRRPAEQHVRRLPEVDEDRRIGFLIQAEALHVLDDADDRPRLTAHGVAWERRAGIDSDLWEMIHAGAGPTTRHCRAPCGGAQSERIGTHFLVGDCHRTGRR